MAKEADNSFGISSVMLALLSLSLTYLIYPPFLLGIVGLVFGIVERRRANSRWALCGIILSIIGIIIPIILFFLLVYQQ